MISQHIKHTIERVVFIFKKLFWDNDIQIEEDDVSFMSLLGKILTAFTTVYLIYTMSSSRKKTEDDDTIDRNASSETSSISSLVAEPNMPNRGLYNRGRTSDYSDSFSERTDPLDELGFSNSDIDLAHDFATSHISRFYDEDRQYEERYQQSFNLSRLSDPLGMQNESRSVALERTPRLRRPRNIRTPKRRSLSPRLRVRTRRSAPNQCLGPGQIPVDPSVFRKTRSGVVYGVNPPENQI